MIELRAVTPENHLEVRALAVAPDQQKFVATVDKTLADAFVWKDALVRAAYKADTPVGFVCIYPLEDNGESVINITRLFVDAAHQGQGLGRALLMAVLDWIGELTADRIRISTLPDNKVALSLYRSAGFVEAGLEEGEIALYRSAL